MAEAPANKGAAQPMTASRITAITPASGGRSAKGAATSSSSDFLERDINRNSYLEVPAHVGSVGRAIFQKAILKTVTRRHVPYFRVSGGTPRESDRLW